ncbi:FAD-dependent oxidoreductase [Alkalicoccobacillus murimartini]|uniref:NADPH-dependent 2,4-dienoyl-CoA reductase/sulfur reductase-like enzyme n=1 Tax=Alkalicoccobacillus murimartini TaxID=171685 RepID=A0ABT9YHS3_9BACI|nr:FAD-dependent oxidoreductase [Alkalicoccobacillus murimartini]MDQ0207061.1 NADPH-dependent 2,4-dienoyl-CoA reductase/sulfur reductase-like enzyme [Alkalicoccobacillus murimartini]
MNYVIIGGDAAGMSAAMQIIRNDKEAKVTVLESGTYYSYAQCGLPYLLSGVVGEQDDLVARDVETFRQKHGIDARVNHTVTSIDTQNKTVSGEDFTVQYDKLLVATGARPIVPKWNGFELGRIHTLKTIPDALRIMENLTDEVKHVTIVGGGYIGLEVAENIVMTGRKVTLVNRSERLGAGFEKSMSKLIQDEAETHGVELMLGEEVHSFKGNQDGNVTEVSTTSRTIQTDMVIAAVGVTPNTDFLSGSGIHLSEKEAIKVNAYLETNVPDIYAAGDCATQYHRLKQKDDFLPLGTHANKQGRLAGLNMIGNARPFQGVVGTAIMQFFDLTLAKTGLNSAEAQDLGFPCAISETETSTSAAYHPNAERINSLLVYHGDTEQVLGGQFIGKTGVDKRVDVLATALYYKVTMEEIENLDLSYAPPYNSVWDPLQQTARRR